MHDRPTYTRDQADRALPLIRAIARDFHVTYVDLRQRLQAYQRDADLSGLRHEEDLPEEIRDRLAELRGLVAELQQLGVTLEDPELGLVSFRGLEGEQVVNFCWKLGEDGVRYAFDLDESYQQRRPLATS